MKPFRYGDVCNYIGKEHLWGGTHIIGEANHVGNDTYEYSTSQGAWIAHDELELIEKSSKATRSKLHKILEEEEEWE